MPLASQSRWRGAIGISDSVGMREETMWAIRRLLERIARDRPVILGLDDLQSAEPTFLDLIEYLVGWSSEAPILIVGLARPELLDRYPGWLSSKPGSTEVRLEPLSDQHAQTLLELLRGDAEVSPAMLARITRAAEGNPLFVEQMLAMMIEDGTPVTDLAIPPSIHALLAARLDRLDPIERGVIERASVVGKEFWRGAIRDLSPSEERDGVGASLDDPRQEGAPSTHTRRFSRERTRLSSDTY